MDNFTFSLGKGLNYFLSFHFLTTYCSKLRSSNLNRHFLGASRSFNPVRVFCVLLWLCKFEDDKNYWKTLWSGEPRSVARK